MRASTLASWAITTAPFKIPPAAWVVVDGLILAFFFYCGLSEFLP